MSPTFTWTCPASLDFYYKTLFALPVSTTVSSHNRFQELFVDDSKCRLWRFSNISKGFGVQRVYLYKDLHVTFFFWRHLYISWLFILIFYTELHRKARKRIFFYSLSSISFSWPSETVTLQHWLLSQTQTLLHRPLILPITILPNPNKYLSLATVFHYHENMNTSVMNPWSPTPLCKVKREARKERVNISLMECTLYPPAVNN